MKTQLSTQENINKLTEFRQAIYSQLFSQRREAQFEVLEALLVKGKVPSFAWLSTARVFQRQWPSLYDALEAGQQDVAWLRSFLAQQVPQGGVQYWALDGTAWPRSGAATLPERRYVYHPYRALNGKPVVAGYAYSLLAWVPAAGQSWALSVDVARVRGQETDLTVGLTQIKRLVEVRSEPSSLDIIAADCKYSDPSFLRGLVGVAVGLVTRLRPDRVLYGPPPPKVVKSRGRHRKHGDRFAFKEPDTWGEPDEVLSLDDPTWGRVELRRWSKLHAKSDAEMVFEVVQARVHLERAKPPQPLWLLWRAPAELPGGITITAETIWRGYTHRWPIEPAIRFNKQTLNWTLPQFHTAEAGDRWSTLVQVALWQLYLARPLVADCPLPWQPRLVNLTPARVRQGWADIFGQFPPLTAKPKTRGKSPGWPQGQPRKRRDRQPVVKKTTSQPKSAAKTA